MLEVGCGWIGSFLDRMDAVYETISAKGVPLSHAARRSTSGASASSPAIPTRRRRRTSSTRSAAQCFVWATDYPHPDHPGSWARSLERFVAPLSRGHARRKVLGENVRRIYEHLTADQPK